MLGLSSAADPTYRSSRNSMMIMANAPLTGCLQIMEGWAIRYALLSDGRRQILSILLPGDITGLEALVSRPASYWVQATTAVSYRVFDPERIWGLESANDGALAPKVMEFFQRQQRAADSWLACIGGCNAEQRTIFFFLDLYSRLKELGLSRGNSYEVHLTQQQMADALGLHLIHFHRVLGRLHVKRLLSVSDGRVVLLDQAQLRTLCTIQLHAEAHSHQTVAPQDVVLL